MKLQAIMDTWKSLKNNKKIQVVFYLFTIINALVIMLVAFIPFLSFESPAFIFFTALATGIFFIEYVWHIVISKNKIKYIFSFGGIIQIFAVIPFTLLQVMSFRLVKLLIGMNTFQNLHLEKEHSVVLGHQIRGAIKREKALLIKSFLVIIVLMLFSAFAVFSFENAAQPDKFKSLFDAVWWSFQTGSTVGYGDIVPITVQGRLVAMILSFIGIASFSIPTTIISTGFIQRNRNKRIIAEIKQAFESYSGGVFKGIATINGIERLATLLENGSISEEEYEQLKKQLLKEHHTNDGDVERENLDK